MKKNNKGFTLAELLIVVAIIAVLVAIAIPIFSKRLESSREATDVANLRSAYAAAQVGILSGDIVKSTMYYNPNASTGLSSTGTVLLGQGTSTDGGTDTSGLPTEVQNGYKTSTNAKKLPIKLTFNMQTNGSKTFAKSLNKIEFAQ